MSWLWCWSCLKMGMLITSIWNVRQRKCASLFIVFSSFFCLLRLLFLFGLVVLTPCVCSFVLLPVCLISLISFSCVFFLLPSVCMKSFCLSFSSVFLLVSVLDFLVLAKSLPIPPLTESSLIWGKVWLFQILFQETKSKNLNWGLQISKVNKNTNEAVTLTMKCSRTIFIDDFIQLMLLLLSLCKLSGW